MRIVRIPKRNGKFRTVYVPNANEKAEYRKLLVPLTQIAYKVCDLKVVHGFMPGRSPLTNALAHLNRDFTLSVDLKDFFDTVTYRQIGGIIPDELIDKVLVDGAARQGLPTSPIVANIAAAMMDIQIKEALGKHTVYTRYADDLTFSSDSEGMLNLLAERIVPIVQSNKFRINESKTHLQKSTGGRRIITGVAVDKNRAYPTRAVKRRLRAAIHQGHTGSIAGLREWIKQKPPAGYCDILRGEYEQLKAVLVTLNGNAEVTDAEYGKLCRALILDTDPD